MAEVSLAPPYPELSRVTGPLPSLVLRAEDMWRRHNQCLEIPCPHMTVRNDAHPRTFRTVVDIDYRDTPRLEECSVRSAELPVSMRMRVRASRKILPPPPHACNNNHLSF
jgi:hypothetical protein